MYLGSCLCGKVTYEVLGELKNVSHCHCTMCQKAHGAAFGSYGNVLRTDFHFLGGEESVQSYQSSAGVTRTFCRVCGSTLQWMREEKHPQWISIALGTLDTPFSPPSQKHIYVETRAPWNRMIDEFQEPRQDPGINIS